MAQNITLLGASYSDVPSVLLPKTGGGQASFTDVTDTTAAASDVAQGKYFYTAAGVKTEGTSTGGGGTQAGTVTQDANGYIVLDDDPPTHITVESLSVTQNGTYTAPTGKAYSPVTVNVSGGGGGGGDIGDPIRFFDYDGTLVASYSSVPASLPSVPTHTGLTNGTWNYTLQQVTTQFNATGTCDVGANYDTASGDTEIDVRFADAARLSPTLTLAVNGTIELDWGDGSALETVTGTSLTSRKSQSHTYAAPGEYTIVIHKVSGSWTFYTASSYQILRKGTNSNENRVYANCIQAIRLGSGITSLTAYSFSYCMSMEYITIPTTVTSIGTNAFYYCYSLNFVSIPSTLTTLSNYTFYNCLSLNLVSIPNGVTSIATNVFANCYSLCFISLPSTIVSIGNTAFGYCGALASLVVPPTVESIGITAFTECYGVMEYHIKPTTPPTISTGIFQSAPSDMVIYVPSASLATYQTAENWATYATKMVGE